MGEVFITITPSSSDIVEFKIFFDIHSDTKGSYGKVYNISKNYIIKRTDIFFDNGLFESNLREVNFLSEYKHKNIVNILDCYITEEKYNIILERGITLDKLSLKMKYIERIKLSLKIIQQISSAIYFLNINDLYHQDIKINNIIALTENNKYIFKLIDFGGIEFKGNIQTKSLCTKEYRAPESFSGIFNIKGDIFSLGITVIDFILKDFILMNSDKETTPKQLKYHSDKIKNIMYSPDEQIIYLKKSLTETKNFFLLELLQKMTDLNYKSRINAEELYSLFHKDKIYPIENYHSLENVYTDSYREKIFNFSKNICLESGVKEFSPILMSLYDRYLLVKNKDTIFGLISCLICTTLSILDAPYEDFMEVGDFVNICNRNSVKLNISEFKNFIIKVIKYFDFKFYKKTFASFTDNMSINNILKICSDKNIFSNFKESLKESQKLII